jgi:hypothetical protein
MRVIKFGITLLACLSMAVLLIFSGVYGQSATPDPIEVTTTALVSEATQQALLTGFSAQSASPISGGTATPLAGICQSFSFRSLDDVVGMIEYMFGRVGTEALNLESVTVSAIEETANCIDFTVREIAADVLLSVEDVETLHDETALGEIINEALDVLSQTVITSLSNVHLKLGVTFGNQTRMFEIAVDTTFWEQIPNVESADLIAWLTER